MRLAIILLIFKNAPVIDPIMMIIMAKTRISKIKLCNHQYAVSQKHFGKPFTNSTAMGLAIYANTIP